jgi:biotin carboxyl carrier protein
MEFEYIVDGVPRKIAVEKKDGTFLVRDAEMAFAVDIVVLSDSEMMLCVDGRTTTAYLARDGKRKIIFVEGRTVVVLEPGAAAEAFHKADEKALDGGLRIRAPMPGKVIKVQVAEGEDVRKHQTLAIVEAMKMENEITSEIDGRVKKVHVVAGDLVDSDKMLIELEPKNI